eukprot:g3538.t1
MSQVFWTRNRLEAFKFVLYLTLPIGSILYVSRSQWLMVNTMKYRGYVKYGEGHTLDELSQEELLKRSQPARDMMASDENHGVNTKEDMNEDSQKSSSSGGGWFW